MNEVIPLEPGARRPERIEDTALTVLFRRRTVFLRAAIATAAVGTVGATETVLAPTASAASGPGDVVGKITVGYQGWFACIGDGAPINSWWHYSRNASQPPSPTNTTIVSWPDVRDYTATYQTASANLAWLNRAVGFIGGTADLGKGELRLVAYTLED